jgi:uroporphyrinogen-III synthase
MTTRLEGNLDNVTSPGATTEDLMSGVEPLAGFTVGITAARRRDEFGAALERRGAKILYGPAIRIIPFADDTQLLEATKRCLAAPLDLVVATTGIGFRGWMDAAHGWDLAEPLLTTLQDSTILARGPKVRGAVRAVGLRENWSPESESTCEVLEYLLANFSLEGRRVAVQLHGEPLPDLVNTLRSTGADVIEVPVYRWVPPDDEQPLRRLIEATAAGTLDAVGFTSAPAAANFLRTAEALGLTDAVKAALRGRVLAACVGSVTAAPLERAGIPVVQPDRARLGALIREIIDQLSVTAPVVVAAGHRIELRGHAALVDDDLRPIPGAGMSLLRMLASRPGQVFSRETLAELLPGDSREGHAVEVAMGRLRTALGDPKIVVTVLKRGYRLAV